MSERIPDAADSADPVRRAPFADDAAIGGRAPGGDRREGRTRGRVVRGGRGPAEAPRAGRTAADVARDADAARARRTPVGAGDTGGDGGRPARAADPSEVDGTGQGPADNDQSGGSPGGGGTDRTDRANSGTSRVSAGGGDRANGGTGRSDAGRTDRANSDTSRVSAGGGDRANGGTGRSDAGRTDLKSGTSRGGARGSDRATGTTARADDTGDERAATAPSAEGDEGDDAGEPGRGSSRSRAARPSSMAESSLIANVLGVPPAAAVGVAAAFTAIGVAVDLLRTGTLGTVFAVCYVTGCVLATAWVRRNGLFWPMVTPPLLMAVAVPVVVVVAGTTKPGAGVAQRLLVIGAPLVNGFPMMAWTTGLVLALGVFRLVTQRIGPRPRGKGAARAEGRT